MGNDEGSEKTVCMPVYSYYPFDLRVRRAAEALIEKGYSVDVLCLRDTDENKFETYNGVNIHRVSLIHRRGGYLRYFYHYTIFCLLIFIQLNKLDKNRKYKFIHVHSLPDFLVFVAIIQKIRGRKVILDLHELMPEIFAARFDKDMNSFTVRLMGVLEELSTAIADGVITVNDVRKEVLINRGVIPGKITVIMNTPDEKLLIKRNLENFKVKLNLEGKFITVYVGGINYERNLEVVLRAMSLVNREIPNIFFIIFGHTYGESGKKYMEELKALTNKLGLSENIYFGGQISGEDVASYLELADFGIVSYVKNPMTEMAMPNKIFEYISANVPIISCRLRGIYTLLGDRAAIYYEPEDHKDLADKIKCIYLNKDKRAKMLENSRNIYENHTWKVMKQRLQNLYENI